MGREYAGAWFYLLCYFTGLGVRTMSKRILVVDDNRLILNLVRVNLVSCGYEVITASDGFCALRMAVSERPDLIILDVMMPEMDGFEVARQIRNNTLIAHVPIIMLTARGSVESVIEGLDAGADDYISKPFEMPEVLARVKAHLRRSRSERSLSPMTGLPGNITIEERLKQLAAAKLPFAVIYGDIDNFKSFNDAYGFLQGDEAIKLLAHLILEAVRKFGNPNDFVGHIGGDDFVICTTPDRVDAVCQDVIRGFEEQIRLLYNPVDRERGYVVGLNREGQNVHHTLVGVSLAVVTNEYRDIDTHWEIGEIAAEVKRAAKQIDHSVYIKDLRGSRSTGLDDPLLQRMDFSDLPPAVLITQDKVLRLVTPVILKRYGFNIVLAESISEGLTMHPAVMLLDERMLDAPSVDQAWQWSRWNPVILFSQEQGAKLCQSLPESRCFSVPVNLTKCSQVLRDIYMEIKERQT